MANDIRTTIMLASLSISLPEMRRNAKEEASKIEADAGAKSGTVTAAKHLMAGVVKHKDIKDYAAMVRAKWNVLTLPWFDGRGAPRAFNAAAALELQQQVAEWRRGYFERVEAFMPEYPAIRAKRQFEMGALFDPKQFPPPEVLRSKFDFKSGWYPLPDSEDIRTMKGIDKKELDKIAEAAAERERQQLASAMGSAAQRLYKVVKSMHDTMNTKIGEKGAKFNNSKLENILEMAELIPQLNLTNDPKLNEMAKLAKKLATKSPDELREDEVKREAAAKEAKTLADKLSTMFSADAEEEEE